MTRIVDRLELSELELGAIHDLWVTITENGLGRPTVVPALVARGAHAGPVVGITAALHGNELNGIPTIHRLFERLAPEHLHGTVVGIPVLNSPGYLRNQREFSDDSDLNRLFPGDPNGSAAEIYVNRVLERIVRPFDYLIDLHTASFGRINSLYVRADMSQELTAMMARTASPQIIVHNEGGDGTLRAAADELGIHAITLEIGDPQLFQQDLIRSSRRGIIAILDALDVLQASVQDDSEDPVECRRSYWIYADRGGILEVLPDVTDSVSRGDDIAIVRDVFGGELCRYHAPEDGVVVGKSTNPVASTGARVLHLGIVGAVQS